MKSFTKLFFILIVGVFIISCEQAQQVTEKVEEKAQKTKEMVEEKVDEAVKEVKEAEGTISVDSSVPKYSKVSGVSGNVNSVGSDTMNNLMALWCEGFARYYPNVKCQIEGKGSSTAPPALIEGISTFGPMSRAMKSKEVDAFEKAFGYKPTQIPTSIDTLAVYVNKDNPVDCLSIKQVDAIFSKNRTCGGGSDIPTWGRCRSFRSVGIKTNKCIWKKLSIRNIWIL